MDAWLRTPKRTFFLGSQLLKPAKIREQKLTTLSIIDVVCLYSQVIIFAVLLTPKDYFSGLNAAFCQTFTQFKPIGKDC